jgi:hypothetical protein
MKRKYLTPRKAIGELVKIEGTPYKVVVPFSSSSYGGSGEFSLGSIKFQVRGYGKGKTARAMSPLPESWLVNINE